MERKYAEAEEYVEACERVPIKSSPKRIVVHKRERGFRYFRRDDPNERTVAIIYFYLGPDGSERKNVRLLVIEGVTYTPEILELPYE